jgi:hypothetical protein
MSCAAQSRGRNAGAWRRLEFAEGNTGSEPQRESLVRPVAMALAALTGGIVTFALLMTPRGRHESCSFARLFSKEAIMASNRSTKAKRASAADPRELRALKRDAEDSASARSDPAAAQLDNTEEATGRPAQRAAIEQAMARQNVRLERSPGAIGPVGRTLLLVALLTLVGLLAVWVLIAL